jgi:hypothetical protein
LRYWLFGLLGCRTLGRISELGFGEGEALSIAPDRIGEVLLGDITL